MPAAHEPYDSGPNDGPVKATPIEWDGEWFATLIESPDAKYLVPPVVVDESGKVIEGRELLAAIIETGTTIEHPVVVSATPAALAEIDQRMARISEALGVPIVDALARTEEEAS